MTRDTEYLIYDRKIHRYHLNPDCLDGHPYRDEQELIKNLKNQANNLYSWIYYHVSKFSTKYVEYVLAIDADYKEAIKNALLACYEADIKSGYSDIKNYAGNVENGSFVPDFTLIDKLVPIEAKIAIRSVDGPNIFFMGIAPTLPWDRYTRYDY